MKKKENPSVDLSDAIEKLNIHVQLLIDTMQNSDSTDGQMNLQDCANEERASLPGIHDNANYGNVYAAIVQARNTEATLYWNRYNILGALVVGFTAAGLAARPDSAFVENWKWVSAAGVALSSLWLFVALAGRTLITYWNDKVIALENYEHGRSDWRTFTHLKGSPRPRFYMDCIRDMKHLGTQPFTYLAASLPLLAICGWIALMFHVPTVRTEIADVQRRLGEFERAISHIDRDTSRRLQALNEDLRQLAITTVPRSDLIALQRQVNLLTAKDKP